ncbi:hypothetical protein O9K51_08067 [Purpureocillium lavendulum]|uniref:Uncharacterized protein n=1 Tax=Purpureocillium lavendulum TaxID=1247861 RepID=A0AB34FMV4_9HYPO|nr:hypothetical protein O9K51_08067 [Purpureocillium lavendulum]
MLSMSSGGDVLVGDLVSMNWLAAEIENPSTLIHFKRHGSRGLIFTYESGARYAIGECRLGVHSFEEYVSPTHICFKPPHSHFYPIPLVYKASQVKWTTSSQNHHHEETDWVCLTMTGWLNLNVDHGRLALEHLDIDPNQLTQDSL